MVVRSRGFTQATVRECRVRDSGSTRCTLENSSGTSSSNPAPLGALSNPEERVA